MIVIDASAVIAMLLGLRQAAPVMDRAFANGETLHAPHLIDVEVTQVVRRYWRAGDLTPIRGEQVLQDLSDLPIVRYPHEPLLPRMWELRHNATAYDAAYIALAEGLNAVFLTLDAPLGRAARARVRVEVIQ